MLSVDFTKIGLKTPERVIPMTTSSASTNYYVKNQDGEFLVKFKTNQKRINFLLENYRETSGHAFCPQLLFEKQIDNIHVFVTKWIDGQSYFLEKLPLKTLKEITTAYLSFIKLINKNKDKTIMPAEIPSEFYKKIQSPYRFMLPELRAVQSDLSYHPTLQIIHGDFHLKNIIIKDGNLKSFIDFESFQLGIPTEDLIRLLLTNAEQHRLFRTGYTVRLLKFLIHELPFSKEDWPYGLDIFVLAKYAKKLKKKNLLGYISLYRCTLLYHKLRQVIHKSFK